MTNEPSEAKPSRLSANNFQLPWDDQSLSHYRPEDLSRRSGKSPNEFPRNEDSTRGRMITYDARIVLVAAANRPFSKSAAAALSSAGNLSPRPLRFHPQPPPGLIQLAAPELPASSPHRLLPTRDGTCMRVCLFGLVSSPPPPVPVMEIQKIIRVQCGLAGTVDRAIL